MTAPSREASATGQERVVPVVSPGPLVPVADFGPTDQIRGWVVLPALINLSVSASPEPKTAAGMGKKTQGDSLALPYYEAVPPPY